MNPPCYCDMGPTGGACLAHYDPAPEWDTDVVLETCDRCGRRWPDEDMVHIPDDASLCAMCWHETQEHPALSDPSPTGANAPASSRDFGGESGRVPKRRLSDSEARWEAVNLLAAAATDFVNGGAVVARGEAQGWTEADMIAVESHVHDRVDGLIRRPRKGVVSGANDPPEQRDIRAE